MIKRWGIIRQKNDNIKSQTLKDVLEAREIVINSNFSDALLKIYNQAFLKSNNAQVNRFVALYVPKYTIEFLSVILLCLPVLLFYINQTDQSDLIGDFAILAVAFVRIIPGINTIIAKTNEISFSKASSNFINRLIEISGEIQQTATVFLDKEILLCVETSNSINTENKSFEICENEVVSIIGSSGIGRAYSCER